MEMDEFMDDGDANTIKSTSNYTDFLIQYAQDQIDKVKSGDITAITITYQDLAQYNNIFAEELIDLPEEIIDNLNNALVSLIASDDDEESVSDLKRRHHVRIIGCPNTRSIRSIRNDDVDQFICIEGMVRTISEVKAKVIRSAWRCAACGVITFIDQEPGGSLTRPDGCTGCDRKTLKYRDSISIKQDAQLCRLQERPEGLRGGELPQAIFVELTDDLCGILNAGTSAKVTGVLKTYIPSKSDSAFCEMIFIANSIELNQEEYEDLEITDEDKCAIEKIASDPNVYSRITKSISPAIYGNEDIKQAVALLLFGGIPKYTADGSRIRGDINVLIVSDPGQAKSQMLRYVAKLAPRSVLTTGNASTKAGLCVAPHSKVWINSNLVSIESIVEQYFKYADVLEETSIEVDPIRMNTWDKNRITHVWKIPAPDQMVRLTVQTGIFGTWNVEVTQNTQLMTSEGWVRAGDISIDTILQVPYSYRILLVTVKDAQLVESSYPYVYDFTVENSHAFIADSIFVHNTASAVKDDFGDGRWTLEAGAMVLADRGCCLHEDQMVVTSTGIKPIKEIKVGDRVVGYNTTAWVEVTNTICNGIKDIVTVTFRNGESIRVTPDHNVWTKSGWKEAGTLTMSDSVVTPALYYEPEEFNEIEFDIGFKNGGLSSQWRVIGELARIFETGQPSFIPYLSDHAGYLYIKHEYADVLLWCIGVPCYRDGDMVIVSPVWPYSKLKAYLYGHLSTDIQDHYFPDAFTVFDPLPDEFWSQVVSVEKSGSATVYDIEVDSPEHNFWIPGCIVHNCIIDEFDKMNESDRSSLHEALEQNCYDDQTEILTDAGWKLFKDLDQTELVATLNPKTNEIEWNKPYQYICKDYSGTMISFSAYTIDLLVTPNHNMYTRDSNLKGPFKFIRADEIPRTGMISFKTEESMRRNRLMFGNEITDVQYTGKIYCVEVENHIIYVRRHGIPVWCGNTVSVAKAGICATLQARCSVLAAANPQYGRFDPTMGMAEQINMIPSLLSRFDLIFTMTDTPSQDRDSAIADHILNVHEVYGKTAAGVEYDEAMMQSVIADIPPDMIRKYIAYARQNIIPVLSNEARVEIKKYYISLRKLASDSTKPVPVTAREIEAMIRLAEASAKIRLSKIITLEDATRVVEIVDKCLKCIAYDPETGELDIDRMETSTPKAKRDKFKVVLAVIKDYQNETNQGILESDLISKLTLEHGMDSALAEDTIAHLHKEASIIKNKGRIRTV